MSKQRKRIQQRTDHALAGGVTMIDFTNREYEKVLAVWSRYSVVFRMKNGLDYIANLTTKHIKITVWPDEYYKMGVYSFIKPEKISKYDLEDAEKILKTAELPNIKNSIAVRMERLAKKFNRISE